MIGYVVLGVFIALCACMAIFARRAWAKSLAAFLALLLLIPTGYLLWLICIAHLGWTYPVSTVSCGGGNAIDIRAPYYWESAQGLLYQARKGRVAQLRYESHIELSTRARGYSLVGRKRDQG